MIRTYLPDPSYQLILFGSQATQSARPFSDIDIGIVGKAPLPFTILGRINEALEESSLPVRVDIVDFARTSVAFRRIAKKYAVPL